MGGKMIFEKSIYGKLCMSNLINFSANIIVVLGMSAKQPQKLPPKMSNVFAVFVRYDMCDFSNRMLSINLKCK